MMGEGKLIGLGRAVKKSREGRGQATEPIIVLILARKHYFHFKGSGVNLAPYQASAAGL